MHRPTRGVDGLDHGVLAAQPSQQPLAVARDDEQRVVDAHPQADEQRQLVTERGHLDHVGEQPDHGNRSAESERGAEQRQRHREQRTEHEEQHYGGSQEPERKAARTLLISGLRDLPLDFDLDAVARSRAGRVHEVLGGGGLDLVVLDVERHVRERHPARGRDL